MRAWVRDVIACDQVQAMPVMTYPGLALTGGTVRDVVTSGAAQAEVVGALARRYQSAAAVTTMDLSVEAEAFGARVDLFDDEVPTTVGAVVTGPESAAALGVPPIGAARTGEYLDAMARTAATVTDRPVLGGAIGPYSLAGRLLGVDRAIMATRRSPDLVNTVLERATAFLEEYLTAIRATGVAGVLIAEPLAGLLSPAAGETFAFRYVARLVAAVQRDDFAVVLHNCGRAARQVPAMVATGAAALHVGNAVAMADVAAQVPDNMLFCGNLDPVGALRLGTAEQVRAATIDLLGQMRRYPNFVLSSGCDIPPLTPLANVDAMFSALADWNAGLAAPAGWNTGQA